MSDLPDHDQTTPNKTITLSGDQLVDADSITYNLKKMAHSGKKTNPLALAFVEVSEDISKNDNPGGRGDTERLVSATTGSGNLMVGLAWLITRSNSSQTVGFQQSSGNSEAEIYRIGNFNIVVGSAESELTVSRDDPDVRRRVDQIRQKSINATLENDSKK